MTDQEYEDMIEYFGSDLVHNLDYLAKEAYFNGATSEDEEGMVYFFKQYEYYRRSIASSLKAISNVYLNFKPMYPNLKSESVKSIENTFIIPYLLGELMDIENKPF
jgi:hypothetical protein